MIFVQAALQIILGIAGGLAVGSGVIAFFIVLDIMPRLAQLTRTYKKSRAYEKAMIIGSVLGTVVDFWNICLPLPGIFTWIPGLFCGVFIGLLAAALTEVLNLLPILAKRLHMTVYMLGLLMAMVLGKVTGSLFDWFVYNR
ncbi:stage V sporulation protein AB [Paenibacillus sp. SEL3]|jgi:stage V sporulation protein AB|uniref:Stage V sporulation protein AB n=1 Tax=Paenibacillus polymyxa TaxID=1406 RepID=A0A8I1LPX6_PAEPO|nr:MULTISPECIES: stage V sporulation protein AB [Paenibacillus]KAF6575191.1 stage V sporulation protein AB [Paenibacillus sp. EKM206P]KAF6590136.1 stage V sporulation protein AB [Paenibacillus sp. EKM205P]MBM0632515.1 stage V sporulation protein AB [Paenibacillus polymyxa]MBO3286691.1 stage V sporulation protein AB [Paenibacillus polymyxa]ODB51313.1 stage V sporulation protein AB [Paenibacillus polymyxa]